MKSDRIISASETLARVHPFLAGYGITRVARHTNLDSLGIPVWCAYTPNSKSLVISNGKGLNDDDARASAVMEAIERAIAGDPECQFLTGSITDLVAGNVEPLKCPELLAKGSKVPPDEQVQTWIEGRCVFSDGPVAAPADAIMLDRTRKTPYHMTSDGLASGNNQAEAIAHALLERIERDAFVLWQLSSPQRRHATAVDTNSITSFAVRQLLDTIAKSGLRLQLFDITSDIGIPTYHALLGPKDLRERWQPRHFELTAGTGTHPRGERAIARAITEAAQSRLTYMSGARDDLYAEVYEQRLKTDLMELFEAAASRAIEISDPVDTDLLEITLAHLHAAGINRAYVFPLSLENKPFSVVKVVVPDLENLLGAFDRPFGHRALKRILRR
ncbi:YcaO-like family protein [Endobacterium cereale]|uniref:YcaO-like family protein n=1 Tax=Endobacterium cereale TaxID=2663029 RepID=UPI0012953F00|nr:YcaO-like family protein [Endobacterium cereale]MEB2846783.1 YcaO-like family protein [Endobacterium cereale]